MTILISHLFLQHYWWIIISLLAGLLVLLMFVQGGQTFIFSLPGSDMQKTMIVNTMGRKWEFTFTTLVTFGGAFFASFPLFYATSFGGAYWVWIAILFSFIIQAIAYEFRSKPGNILGQKTFDIFLFLNGSLGPFLIGVAVATFFSGSRFSLNPLNQVQWDTQWYGLEALLNIRNLALGFAVLFLSRINGLLYIVNTIDDGDLIERSVVLIIFLCGVTMVLYGIGISLFRKSSKGIWFSGAGTVLTVFSLFIVAGFNWTSFYPSSHDLRSSLTISNASSSLFTLKTMMYVSFVIPFVIIYIWYAWKAINNKKITSEEMISEDHKY
jgi:cytochrome d ubiquinol oxidase subunit II